MRQQTFFLNFVSINKHYITVNILSYTYGYTMKYYTADLPTSTGSSGSDGTSSSSDPPEPHNATMPNVDRYRYE